MIGSVTRVRKLGERDREDRDVPCECSDELGSGAWLCRWD